MWKSLKFSKPSVNSRSALPPRDLHSFVAITLVTLALIFGMWQASETGSSNVTALSTNASIGVFWDSAATQTCDQIDWGQLNPGSRKNVVVFVKNQINETLFYLLTTQQWSPPNASNSLALHWDYDNAAAHSGTTKRVCLTLLASPRIEGTIDFSFNIVIKSSTYMWSDINYDKKIDIWDVGMVVRAYNLCASGQAWNEKADINQDGTVNIKDVAITSKNYGTIYV